MMSKLSRFLVVTIAIGLILFGCGKSSDNQLTKVRDLLDQGKLGKADTLITELAKADTLSAIKLMGGGYISEYQGFPEEALPKYLEAAKVNNGYWPGMEAYTELALKQGYVNSARLMAYIMVRRQPENPRGYLYLSKIYLQWELYDSAVVNMVRADSLGLNKNEVVLQGIEIELAMADEVRQKAAAERLGQVKPETPEQISWQAALYRSIHQIDSAIACMRRVVAQTPKSVHYRLQLAQYLYDDRHLNLAQGIVDTLMKEAEKFGPAFELAAYVKYLQKKETLGELLFLQYIGLRESGPDAIERHGDFYVTFGEWDLAMIEYENAYVVAANLRYADEYIYRLHVKMQRAFLEDGAPDLATSYIEEGVQLAADSLAMHFIRRELVLELGSASGKDSVEALITRDQALNWNYRIWISLAADMYRRLGRAEKAIECNNRLLGLPRPTLECYLSLLKLYSPSRDLARVDSLSQAIPFLLTGSRELIEAFQTFYAAAGQTEQAARYAERLYLRSPDYLPYISQHASYLARQGKTAEARALFTRYTSTAPSDPAGYCELARFEMDNGMNDSASAHLDNALAIAMTSVPALEMKGILLLNAGKNDSAASYFERVVKLEGQTPWSYYQLARRFLDKNDSLDRAAGLAMTAVRYSKNDIRSYYLLGDIYFAQGKYKLAQEQYGKGVRLYRDDAMMNFKLGRTAIRMSDKVVAQKSLKRALELGLSSPEKEEAEKLLRPRR